MPTGSKSYNLSASGSVFGPEPPASELPKIERFTLGPVDPARLYVRRMVVANDQLDRDFETFSPAVLQRFAETLPGKSLLIAHEKAVIPTGLVYRAEVVGGELVGYWYTVKSPENEGLLAKVDAGVARYVSIGFGFDERFCSACGERYWACDHYPGEKLPDGRMVTYVYGGDLSLYEGNEVSIVYLGAQRGAQITKENHPVDNEKALARIEELTKQLSSLKEAGEKLAAAEKRLSEVEGELETAKRDLAALQGSDAAKALLATDGEAYRQFLRSEIKRYAGILHCEAEADLILTAAPNAEAKGLKALVDSYAARVAEKFPPKGEGVPSGSETPAPADPAPTAFRL